jgi:excisionase family DNA binding protein
MIKLSKAAKLLGVSKMTLWNWMHQGKLTFHKIGSMNFIKPEDLNPLLGIVEKKNESVVIYCRVSSTVNKSNLEMQKQRMISYCNAKGYSVSKVITEFGSGLNDKRPKLEKLLCEQNFTRLVVEHKDRLTRFGFNYIEKMLNANNIQIEVVNNVEGEKEDIIQDFISVITSFSARIYGQRRSKRKTEVLLKELEARE